MRNIVLLLALVLPFRCFAGTPEISEIIAYSGKLGGQNVFMTLSFASGKVIGSYSYRKYGVPIPLTGSVFGSKLLLVEKTESGDAHIDAELKEGSIEGVWKRSDKFHDVEYKALSKSYSAIIKKVDVLKSESENRIVSITFANGASQRLEVSVMEEKTLIIFEDFTFDGYPDMRILELEAGGNSSFIYFDYDVGSKKFKRSSSGVEDFIDPKVIHEEKAIISVSKDGCCIYHAKKILPTEIRSASYDFKLGVGSEVVKNKITKSESKQSINEIDFEKGYLGFMADMKNR